MVKILNKNLGHLKVAFKFLTTMKLTCAGEGGGRERYFMNLKSFESKSGKKKGGGGGGERYFMNLKSFESKSGKKGWGGRERYFMNLKSFESKSGKKGSFC